MSDLSIDEIIKRAEEIKAEAERQLQEAERSLNEKAKNAIDDVVVDENMVLERIAKISAIAEEEEDIKQFKPSKKSNGIFSKARRIDDDEDIKIAKDFSSKKKNAEPIDEDDSDMKLADESKTGIVDLTKTKHIKPKSPKIEEKTREILVSKAETDSESDLKKPPTIVAKEELFKDEREDFNEDVGIQMTFEGFDDKIESIPTIDEELAEQILQENRRIKVDKFRLFGPEETDTSLGNENIVDEEYEDENKREDYIGSLLKKKHSAVIKLNATAIIGTLLTVLSWIYNKPFTPSFLTSHYACFGIAVILYAIAIAINYNIIIHGFNFKKGINADFSVSLTSLILLGHTVALTLSQGLCIDNGVLLAPIGTLALFLSQLGKWQMMVRIIDNFEFISEDCDKYTIENIVNSVDAEIITRGLIDSEPIIKTSVKTDFPTNFLEISCKSEPSDKVSRIIFLASFGASLALFIAVGLIDNFNSGFNCAVSAMAITVPASSIFMTNSMLTTVSKVLSRLGSRVCGVEGARMADNANAMVMEASDLFSADSCEIHGIKTFNNAKIDDAIINAAAVLVQTKSPLANAFDSVIIGKQRILPPIEDVVYEDKMGTSAWIYDRKVLVGNRTLLENHGVKVLKKSVEEKYTDNGKKALYLAIDGEIIAMFIVSYSADAKLKKELKKLEKSGIQIILKSNDPYINEQSIAKLFDLPLGYISVMNYSASRVYEKYSGMTVEKSPAYAVHNGTALGFISAMHGAQIIVSSYHLLNFLEAFGSSLGFLAVALLSVVGAYGELSAINIMACQAIWSAFMLLVEKIKVKKL